MPGLMYLSCWNFVGFAAPSWKWLSCCFCMIKDGADWDGKGCWLGNCSGLEGRVVRYIPLIQTTYILLLAGRGYELLDQKSMAKERYDSRIQGSRRAVGRDRFGLTPRRVERNCNLQVGEKVSLSQLENVRGRVKIHGLGGGTPGKEAICSAYRVVVCCPMQD